MYKDAYKYLLSLMHSNIYIIVALLIYELRESHMKFINRLFIVKF